MTLTDEQMQRVREIAEMYFPEPTEDCIANAIFAALSDPLLVGGWETIESAPKGK